MILCKITEIPVARWGEWNLCYFFYIGRDYTGDSINLFGILPKTL